MRCARHSDVETELACGRCETPICPKCLVITDVGARCQTCVPKRPPLLEEVKPRYLGQALGAAVGVGALLGVIWGVILPPGLGGVGLFGLVLAFLIGYLVAQAVSAAANRRSGWPLQATAVVGVLIAYLVRNLVAEQALLVEDDAAGYISALLAAVVAFVSIR